MPRTSISPLPDSAIAAGLRPLPPRIGLLGIPIDAVMQEQVIAHVIAALAREHGGWVITPNLDQLRLCFREPQLQGMYSRADLVLADGMPLIWASRLQGTPLPERVAGSALIYTLSAAAARAGRTIYLLGGNPCTAEQAAQVLARLYPGLRVAGTHCPPLGFEKDAQQMRSIVDALSAARPDIVFVGLGFPKQEKLIEILRPVLPGAWFLGVGISFSFVSGEIRRAPRWMQRLGLEWMHRLIQEPKRLFGRYLLHDLPFAMRLFGSAIGNRFR
jgi:N-acetylglucosaminyldiphosphoundecaprenol N-acetyl-beta-D-mannosaminyltransferase